MKKPKCGGAFKNMVKLHERSIEILNSFALYMMLAKQNFSFCVRFAVPYATFLNTIFHGKLVANVIVYGMLRINRQKVSN